MTGEFWSAVLPWATVAFSLIALVSTSTGIIARDKVLARKPRVLSDAQRATLIQKLKGHPARIEMVTSRTDDEARDYAGSIASAFRAAGWDVAPTNEQSLNSFAGYVLLGAS